MKSTSSTCSPKSAAPHRLGQVSFSLSEVETAGSGELLHLGVGPAPLRSAKLRCTSSKAALFISLNHVFLDSFVARLKWALAEADRAGGRDCWSKTPCAASASMTVSFPEAPSATDHRGGFDANFDRATTSIEIRFWGDADGLWFWALLAVSIAEADGLLLRLDEIRFQPWWRSA